MMQELGHKIGRFKVRSLMKEAGLTSKQPGSHAYKTALAERPDINSMWLRPTRFGAATSPISGPVVVGITWLR